MKTIKLCDDRRLDAILKTIIAFTSLTLMALCVLYLKDECFDLKKEIMHSMRVAIRILVLFIMIDYIKIKKRMNNEYIIGKTKCERHKKRNAIIRV